MIWTRLCPPILLTVNQSFSQVLLPVILSTYSPMKIVFGKLKVKVMLPQVYNRHGKTLLGKFEKLAGHGYSDIFHTISLCTLDIICEAALGTHVDAQNKSSPYLDAVFQQVFCFVPHHFLANFMNLATVRVQ